MYNMTSSFKVNIVILIDLHLNTRIDYKRHRISCLTWRNSELC